VRRNSKYLEKVGEESGRKKAEARLKYLELELSLSLSLSLSARLSWSANDSGRRQRIVGGSR
jgi:hypothetical protein